MDDYDLNEMLESEFEDGEVRGAEEERARIIDWIRSPAGRATIDQGYKSPRRAARARWIAENIAEALDKGQHKH